MEFVKFDVKQLSSGEKKKSKYGNKKTFVEGIEKPFDSKDEANFYLFLKNICKYSVDQLILQPKFELQPKYIDNEDKKIKEIIYVADFQIDNYVIDVKGFETKDFIIKRKIFKYKYPDLILLVGTSKELQPLFWDIKNK